MRPRVGSNADIFSRRGDPWISGRDQDGTRLHRRMDMTEKEVRFAKITGKTALTNIVQHPVDPDMDRWTKAGFRKERIGKSSDKPVLPKSDNPSAKRRIANIARGLHKKQGGRTIDVKESEFVKQMQARTERQIETENRASRQLTGFSVYIRYADETEEERDRPTRPKADVLFGRMRRRKEVSAIEIWSYATGDAVAVWERVIK